MEDATTQYDMETTIKNLTSLIYDMNPNWIQKIVVGIYLNDIQETYYQRGTNL